MGSEGMWKKIGGIGDGFRGDMEEDRRRRGWVQRGCGRRSAEEGMRKKIGGGGDGDEMTKEQKKTMDICNRRFLFLRKQTAFALDMSLELIK
jgi:hypothetical protein